MIDFIKNLFKKTPVCFHEWNEEKVEPHHSQFFDGNNWKRTCLKCNKKQTGWSQYGRRWGKDGEEIQIERIIWSDDEIVITDR